MENNISAAWNSTKKDAIFPKEYLFSRVQTENLYRLLEIRIQAIHWEEVNVREEDIRCVHLLQTHISKKIHRIKALKNKVHHICISDLNGAAVLVSHKQKQIEKLGKFTNIIFKQHQYLHLLCILYGSQYSFCCSELQNSRHS